jgi:hypothetical protein
MYGGINSASLCSLAGRYDNHIPPQFPASTDCLKIPALGNLRPKEPSKIAFKVNLRIGH